MKTNVFKLKKVILVITCINNEAFCSYHKKASGYGYKKIKHDDLTLIELVIINSIIEMYINSEKLILKSF